MVGSSKSSVMKMTEQLIQTLDEFVYSIMLEEHLVYEKRIRVLLKSAPKFFPEKLWLKLASKFLVIEDE